MKTSPYIFPGIGEEKLTDDEKIKRLIDAFVIRGTPEDFLTNRSRLKCYLWPRHLIRYFLNVRLGISGMELMRRGFGDHATIIHSVNFVLRMKEIKDKEFMETFKNFEI